MEDLHSLSIDEILRRIGRNLERMRLDAQIPDTEVLSRGGIKSSTWTNLKAGSNVTMANLVKALKGLDRLTMLESLIDYNPPVSPMNLVRERSRPLKKRIRKPVPKDTGDFHWGDEP